ncbi:hypothetical protein IJZ97_06770 [bacterium]|nr:hypothetical protein [bacterium]
MSCLDDYPFLMDYFKAGIQTPDKNIAHCILFWGKDIDAQYELATEISRLLNCKLGGKQDCNCLNCTWIKNNAHPAVLTYSKSDNKPSDDDSKTMFSISQARMIKNDLAVTSEYHRVLIFCDRDSEGNLSGLNSTNFSTDAANALLKTFEEPPSNTTFFFLTNDVTDMISTVVSRSQCFFVPSKKEEPQNFELVKDAMDGYLELERKEVLDFNDKLSELVKESNPNEIFTQMQNYMANLLKSNLQNKHLKIKLLHDINAVEKAKKEYKLNINIQTILETLAFDLIL